MYGQLCDFRDAFGYELALVVSSFFLSFCRERHRYDGCDIIEEVMLAECFCDEFSHVLCQFGLLSVLYGVYDACAVCVWEVLIECCCMLYGQSFPEESGHFVVLRADVLLCVWQMSQTLYAYKLFLLCESSVATAAGCWCDDIEQAVEEAVCGLHSSDGLSYSAPLGMQR